jgi:hypothetical protein
MTGVVPPVAVPGTKELLRRDIVPLGTRCLSPVVDSSPTCANFQTVYMLVSRFKVNASTRGCSVFLGENSFRRETWRISSAVSRVVNFVELLLCPRLGDLTGWATTKPISARGSDNEKRRGQLESFFSAGGSHMSLRVDRGLGICLGAPRSAIEKVEN